MALERKRDCLRIKDNVVLNFYLSSKEQAELLKCFSSDNEQILFPFKENWLVSEEDDLCISDREKEFIIKRTIAVSKEHIIYWIPEDDESIYWYSPKDTNELVNLIEKNFYDYISIILEKGKNVKDYTYLLSIEENYLTAEDDTCSALLVNEKIRNSFQDKVVPKIKEKFKLDLP
jgi:hypothetical protein